MIITREDILKHDPALSSEFSDGQLARINEIIGMATTLREAVSNVKKAVPFTDYEKLRAGVKILYKCRQMKMVFADLLKVHDIDCSWDVVLRFLVPRVTRYGKNGLNICTFAFIREEDNNSLSPGKEGWEKEQYPFLRQLLIKTNIRNMTRLPEKAPPLPAMNPRVWTNGERKDAMHATPSRAGSSAMTITVEEPDKDAVDLDTRSDTATTLPASKKQKSVSRYRSTRKRAADVEHVEVERSVTLDTGIKPSDFGGTLGAMIHKKMEKVLDDTIREMKGELGETRASIKIVAPSTLQNSDVVLWHEEQVTMLARMLDTRGVELTKPMCKAMLLDFMRVSADIPNFQEENAYGDHAERFFNNKPTTKKALLLFALECLKIK